MGNILARYDLDMNELLTFRLEKTVTIQVWQVGLVFRLMQIAVVVYIACMLHFANSWAYNETPMGSVNAWNEQGGFLEHANLADYSSLPYCANASLSYGYDASFVMDSPACEASNPYEVTSKEPGQLIFTTAYIEVREVGWDCGDAATDTAQRAACTTRGGAVSLRASSQCVCLSDRAVYPVGVDRMVLAFEHAMAAATSDSRFYDLAASSNTVPDPDQGKLGINSHIVFANGTVKNVSSGVAIRMPLEAWIVAATTEDSSTVRNVTLGGYNVCPPRRYNRVATLVVLTDPRSIRAIEDGSVRGLPQPEPVPTLPQRRCRVRDQRRVRQPLLGARRRLSSVTHCAQHALHSLPRAPIWSDVDSTTGSQATTTDRSTRGSA